MFGSVEETVSFADDLEKDIEKYQGEELRDRFAVAALSAILPVADSGARRCGEDGVQAKAADYARVAYCVADAMMEARKG